MSKPISKSIQFEPGKNAGHLLILSCTNEGYMSRYGYKCVRCSRTGTIGHRKIKSRIQKGITHCEHCKRGPRKPQPIDLDVADFNGTIDGFFRPTPMITEKWYAR